MVKSNVTSGHDGSCSSNGRPRTAGKSIAASAKPRPAAPPVVVESIATELKTEPRWVCWRFVCRNGKWTKVPLNPKGGGNARPNDPRTWGTFDDALGYYKSSGFDGIGFMLGDGYVGIDLDDCITESGELSELATETVNHFATFTDISPSGRGLKLFFRASLTKFPNGKTGTRKDEMGIEAYASERFFTVTGRRYAGNGIAECNGALDWFVGKYLNAPKAKKSRPCHEASALKLDDEQIIERVLGEKGGKANALWRGDASNYRGSDGQPDLSRADAALCAKIAYYTKNAAQIERIFAQSELGKRDKWRDRPDYRERTIAGALDIVTEQFVPGRKARPKAARSNNGLAHESPPDSGEPPRGLPIAGNDQTGAQIILEYFRATYRPVFRCGNAIQCADGREVPMGEAVAVPNSNLIERLKSAVDVPTYKGGGVNVSNLPGFFNKWAKVAWGDLLGTLPEEDDAELGADAPAREEFRRLVREAMLSEVVLGDVIGKAGATQTERRSLIDWCDRFAKGGCWRSIRSKKCWCKRRPTTVEGELGDLMVAIRHELFSQLSADRRLKEMGPKTFARRAARYGVGTSSAAERPHGNNAIVLADDFVIDLIATLPDDEQEQEAHASP